MKKSSIWQRLATGTAAFSAIVMNVDLAAARVNVNHHFHIEAFDSAGKLKWTEDFDNLVVNEGLDDYLEQYYNGSAYTAVHFVGLTDGTPTFAAADTMSSHAGWVEVVEYQADEGSPSASVRPAYVPAAAASQSLSNIASKAVFNIVSGMTVGGAFLTTASDKSGTSGTLVGGNVFTLGDRVLANGDTLNVTVTASMTSS